ARVRDAAAAADARGVSDVVAPIEDERAVVDDAAARDRARRAAESDLQRAAGDRRGAGVGVVAREREHAAARLRDRTVAADEARRGRVDAVEIDGAGGIEGDGARGVEGGAELERAAVDGEPARDVSELRIRRNDQRSIVEDRAAAVAVVAGEREAAAAVLCDR